VLDQRASKERVVDGAAIGSVVAEVVAGGAGILRGVHGLGLCLHFLILAFVVVRTAGFEVLPA
jgi:hypothetical protein